MIRGYTRPQLLVRQILEVLVAAELRSLNAFVVGPQYDLFRYTNEDEKAAMTGTAFVENTSADPADRQLVPYEGINPAIHIVDQAYTRLYAEKIEGRLWQADSGAAPGDAGHYRFTIPSLDEPNKLRVTRRGAVLNITVVAGAITAVAVVFGGSAYPPSVPFPVNIVDGAGAGGIVTVTVNSSGEVSSAAVTNAGVGYTESMTAYEIPAAENSTNVGIKNVAGGDDYDGDGILDYALIPELHGRAVKAGDVLYGTVNGNTVRRMVTGVERRVTASHYGENASKRDKCFAPSAANAKLTPYTYKSVYSVPVNWTGVLTGTADLYVAGPKRTLAGVGTFGDDFTVTVTRGGSAPIIRVRSASGLFSADGIVGVYSSPAANSVYTFANTPIAGLTLAITHSGAGTDMIVGQEFVMYVREAWQPLNTVINGSVMSITLNQAGNYTIPPTSVVLSAPPAGGVQATAVIQTNATTVTQIYVTDPGSGYLTPPNITFVGGQVNTSAAVATATLDTADGLDLKIVQSGVYTGPKDTRYTLTVKTGKKNTAALDNFTGAVVRVTDSAGIDVAQEYTISHGAEYPLGSYGLKFSFPTGVKTPGSGHPNGIPLQTVGVAAVTIAAGGTGYQANDVLTLVGGTVNSAATITVDTVDGGGAITGVTVTTPGEYWLGPTNPAAVTGGSGSGATFNVTDYAKTIAASIVMKAKSIAIGAAGTGYAVDDILSVSGGTTWAANPVKVKVTTVGGGGEVTGVEINFSGLYSVLPTSPAATTTTGGGTGATINVTWEIVSVAFTGNTAGYPSSTTPSLFVAPDPTDLVAQQGAMVGFVIQGKAFARLHTDPAASGSYTKTPSLSTLTLPADMQLGLRTGESWYVDAVAEAKTGPADTIVVSGQLADVSDWENIDNYFNIDLREIFTGRVEPRRNTAPDLAWTAGTALQGGIYVKDSLAIQDVTRDANYQWLPVKESTYGKLFAHWRGLVPAFSADKISLYSDEASILAKFGKFDPDNPVCYGTVMAIRGSQGKPVFAAKLATNDLTGHNTIIRQAERVEGIYAIAPMTMDRDIQNAWKVHVDKVSAADWKLWRRVYIATQNPGPYSVMDTDSEGDQFEAQVLSGTTGNIRVVCATGDFLVRGIRPGDLFRINYVVNEWGDESYDTFEVLTVLDNDELVLTSGPANPINPAVRFEIWRPDNGLSQAEFVGVRSGFFRSRRLVNIWCDAPIKTDADGEPTYTPNYYLAAEAAGLRSAVLPQQGLTYTELDHAVDAAPLMFMKYSQEELNVAAANGTWIITQEVEDGPIFIRHQLTTDSSHGSLYYEDSIGTNLDAIAYAVKDLFQPYIGKRNANPETLEEMETKLRDLLDTFKNNPGGFTKIGPALAAYRNLSVKLDPTFRDRVNIEVLLELPLPINTVIVTLRATTISDQTLIEFQQAQTAAATA